jgi:DNA ligase-1
LPSTPVFLSAAAGTRAPRDKIALLAELLSRLTAEERVFLSGLLTGELRQGALEGLVL